MAALLEVGRMKRPRIAQGLCVRNEETFLEANLQFHRMAGVERVYLFLDRCTDGSVAIAEACPWAVLITVPESLAVQFEYLSDLHRACMDMAKRLADEEGFDWLLFLDTDEFAVAFPERLEADAADWQSGIDLAELVKKIPSQIEQVRFPTWEVVPTAGVDQEPWWRLRDFQVSPSISYQLPDSEELWVGFLGHDQGKSMIRCGTLAQAYDSHRWVIDQRHFLPNRPEYGELPTFWAGCQLHYFITSGRHMREKFARQEFEPFVWPCGTPMERSKCSIKKKAVVWSEAEANNYYRNKLVVSDGAVHGSGTRDLRVVEVMMEVGKLRLDKSSKQLASHAGELQIQLGDEPDFSQWVKEGGSNYCAIEKLALSDLRHFHGLEKARGEVIRWTALDFSIRFAEEMAKGDLIVLGCHRLWDLAGAQEVVLCHDGNRWPLQKMPGRGWSLRLPVSASGWLQFEVTNAVEVTGDPRVLGIPVGFVEWMPCSPVMEVGKGGGPLADVSVILPMRNELTLLPAHLDALDRWVGGVKEILVVDGDSTDGSLELLLERWRHRHPKVFQRDKGLYEAWNFAVRQARGDQIYFATVGDVIEPGGVAYLAEVLDGLAADFVLSPPRMSFQSKPDSHQWPIHLFLEAADLKEPRLLGEWERFVLSSLYQLEGILGSSAANLYRRRTLLNAPFPEDVGHAGDTLWGMTRSRGMRIGVAPRQISTFCRVDRTPPEAVDAATFHTMEIDFLNRGLVSCGESGADASEKMLLRVLIQRRTQEMGLLPVIQEQKCHIENMERLLSERQADLQTIHEQTKYIQDLEQLEGLSERRRLLGVVAEQDAYISELQRQLKELGTDAGTT